MDVLFVVIGGDLSMGWCVVVGPDLGESVVAVVWYLLLWASVALFWAMGRAFLLVSREGWVMLAEHAFLFSGRWESLAFVSLV